MKAISVSISACKSNEFDEADDYVMRDPVNASDFHINSSHVSHDGQLCANNYPDPRSSQIFETIQESLSGRSSPTKFVQHLLFINSDNDFKTHIIQLKLVLILNYRLFSSSHLYIF